MAPFIFVAEDPSASKTTKKNTTKTKKRKGVKLKDVPFPFFKLPPEIRNMIYQLSLVEHVGELSLITKSHLRIETLLRGTVKKEQYIGPGGLKCFTNVPLERKDKDHTCLSPSILRVCCQMNAEAIPYLYGQPLTFEHPLVLREFLTIIGPKNRLLIRDVVLRGWNSDKPAWTAALGHTFCMLSGATSIESLHLDRRVSSRQDTGFRHNSWVAHVQYFGMMGRELSANLKFWAQTIDLARGQGTAKKVLSISDLSLASQDVIDHWNKDLTDLRKVLMDNLKLE